MKINLQQLVVFTTETLAIPLPSSLSQRRINIVQVELRELLTSAVLELEWQASHFCHLHPVTRCTIFSLSCLHFKGNFWCPGFFFFY